MFADRESARACAGGSPNVLCWTDWWRTSAGARAARWFCGARPGSEKTALLEYLAGSASDLTVVRAGGVESEMELAFASLQQLCARLLDRLDRLPGPQRDALGVVFGLNAGPAPDRFLVSLGVLSLLSEVAEERPVLCVVDDAQWLDEASALTLAFVSRRLVAEPVGIVFAAREPGDELHYLPEFAVQGLGDPDARELLDSAVRFKLDERVRERIIAETHGNPLALLELPRGLTSTQLAVASGCWDLSDSRDGSSRPLFDDSRIWRLTSGVCSCLRLRIRWAIRC